jgi:hypothetical protein
MASWLCPRHHLRPFRALVLGIGALVAGLAAPAGIAAAATASTHAPAPPCRLAGPSLDRVPVLVAGDHAPELVLAQRAIRRDFGVEPAVEPGYADVEMPQWKSVGRAGLFSLALPGTGQLYAGSKRGYLYLGVEAVALLSYATFSARSDEKRDEYHEFVGDPNDPASRFSFDRLGASIPSEEIARLRTIYERNPSEFYQAVTAQSQYAPGWQDPDERFSAQEISEDADRQDGRSRASLYTLIANHLVSAADALNLARLTNFALRENMTLKLKLRPGGHHSSYAFTVTQKF